MYKFILLVVGWILTCGQERRRARGGRWYLIHDQSTAWGGEYWSQYPPRTAWEALVREEDWT